MKMRRSVLACGAVLVPLLGLIGCGATSRTHTAAPADALAAYAQAVQRRDQAAAYKLMSEAFRRRVPFEDFRRQMDADRAELAGDTKALQENAERWGASVEVSLGGQEQLMLVREGNSWRLDAQPFEPYGQGTPRAALRTFVRAVQARRYDVLLRLVPTRYRGAVTVEKLRAFWEGERSTRNHALIRELRLALESRVIEEGDEAFLTYGANHQARLVREDGLWRIESPE